MTLCTDETFVTKIEVSSAVEIVLVGPNELITPALLMRMSMPAPLRCLDTAAFADAMEDSDDTSSGTNMTFPGDEAVCASSAGVRVRDVANICFALPDFES